MEDGAHSVIGPGPDPRTVFPAFSAPFVFLGTQVFQALIPSSSSSFFQTAFTGGWTYPTSRFLMFPPQTRGLWFPVLPISEPRSSKSSLCCGTTEDRSTNCAGKSEEAEKRKQVGVKFPTLSHGQSRCDPWNGPSTPKEKM